MSDVDYAYLIRRAEQQLLLAQAASHPAVTAAHYRLANAYLERAHPGLDAAGGRPAHLDELVVRR